MKNTDTFAGFAHAMNSYLAGVALASRHGVGLIHRPQFMAHGLGFAFVDFFDSDPRGIVPPVYTAHLSSNASAMLIDGHPVQLYVQLASAGNASAVASQLNALPPHSLLWLRKGRQSFVEPLGGCDGTAGHEVCYAALWLRERFWRAVLERRRRVGLGANGRTELRAKGRAAALSHIPGAPVNGMSNMASPAAGISAEEGGSIRICVHVRRGDVYYLGPKTRQPHPHWVETATVLDILVGVGKAIGRPLERPGVLIDVYTEVGWLSNDTAALHSIAPGARVHMDSSPGATINAMVAMSMADLLVMGSSGFSFWAGIFSCGVKVGFVRQESESLPMRFVKYASTITTRTAPFWMSAGKSLRREWSSYWGCRRDPGCRASLCGAAHLSPGSTIQGSVWSRSKLARELIADTTAVQWQIPSLILWPDNTTRVAAPARETSALSEMRQTCTAQKMGKFGTKALRVSSGGYGLDSCVRNVWLHNLTAFLAARRKVPHGVVSVGR